uniref:Protein kinase domain-containing protein n=1 Tax=Romanomermis culicivorax TaxID=13658 RepID=A0A915K011_ROMCU
HRDIKPGNYLNGIDQRDLLTIFLVDFGLVRQFTRNGKVRPKRPRAPFRGIRTKRYASINALKELDYGRHDDLISWIYTMVELSTGFLPWATEPDRLKLANAKMKGEKVLCLYVDPVFSIIYEKLTELKYENEPDYEKYKLLLREQIDRHKFKISDHFDWQTGYVAPAMKKLKNQDQNSDEDDILLDFNELVADAVENVVGGVSGSIRKQFQNHSGIKVEGKKTASAKKIVVKTQTKIPNSKKVYARNRQEIAPPDDEEDYIQIENEQNDALLDQV